MIILATVKNGKMVKNYILIAFRSLFKNKIYALINIFGLAIGISCCIYIYLFVNDELSYDRFQNKYDRIHRVIYHATNGKNYAQVPPVISPLMTEFFPEVETSARMYERNMSVQIEQENERREFEEEDVFFADSAIIDIFSFDFIEGNPDKMLKEPFTVVLSKSLSDKYFHGKNAIGRNIILQGNMPFQVVGVFRDYPDNSHIKMNMLLPYDNMYDMENDKAAAFMRENLSYNWVISHSNTYVLLKEGFTSQTVNNKFPDLLKNHAHEKLQVGQRFSLEPMSDFYLFSDAFATPENKSSIKFVYAFSAIAFITLLIACCNFINLSTAHSIKRTKEVGLRKVLGAYKRQLFGQFLGESLIVSIIGFILALLILSLVLPMLNQITDKSLSFSALGNLTSLGMLFLILILAGILGGVYPSYIITRVNVVDTLKGRSSIKPGRFSLRKVLVSFQFMISVTLISVAIVIYNQIDHLLNRPMGFEEEEIINIPIFSNNLNSVFGGVDGVMRQRLNTFEEEVIKHPGINHVTLSSVRPGLGAISRMTIPEGHDPDKQIFVPTMGVDYDFIEAYGLQVISGRDFNKNAGTDHKEAFIINKKFIDKFNWGSPEEAIGKEIDLEGKEGNVIGVIDDFHYTSLQYPIEALILEINIASFNTFSFNVHQSNFKEVTDFLQEKWRLHFPEKTFEYSFLSNKISDQYQSEKRMSWIISIFAVLAILISCLGSYGLVMFSAKRKEKEIGVRKVLGASVVRLTRMLFSEFTWLFLIGFVFAVPLVVYFSMQWLNNYSYKVPVDLFIFLQSGFITLLIIWISISYQSIKAALINPVQLLRDE